MSERQEHKRRMNAKIQWIRDFEKWMSEEPPIIRLFAWRKWKKRKPDYNTYLKEFN